MDPNEAVRLNWLELTGVHGLQLKTILAWLESKYDLNNLVACAALTQGVIGRFRDVYDILERLQRQTREDGDDAPELREPLQDLLFDAYHLRELLERFSEEDVLVQLIRSQKLMDWLEQAHDGVDAFVDAVQRSRYGERFSRLAEITDIDFSEEEWAEAFDSDLLDVNDALVRGFGAARDPVTCPLLNIKFFPDDNAGTMWLLALEKERLRRLGVSNPFLELVEREVRVTKYEAKAAPWFIPSDEISLNHEIGKGGFWRVYLATWGGSKDIAVKCMVRFDKVTLLRVINTSSQLNHPHILRFYGASSPDPNCRVVTELARYGRLDRYLCTPGNKKQVWRLLYEAALGIHYMHQLGYVHGDLKGYNILVGDDLKAKLGGFTLTFKVGDHENVPCSEAHNWAAPERLDRTRKTERSFPSDVYTFGMCIVEALTLSPPYGGLDYPSVRRWVRRGILPISVLKLAPQVQELVKAMCELKPADRMKLEDVIATLKQFADANDPDLLVVSD